MESLEAREGRARLGDDLAEITNRIVRLFSEYYGRGPTRAKTYMLENRYVVTVLRDTMTTVEAMFEAQASGRILLATGAGGETERIAAVGEAPDG